jgi:hypothetical protein
VLLASPFHVPRAISHLDHGGMHIHLSVVLGLHEAEMRWKLERGCEDLLRLFGEAGVDAVVRPERPCVPIPNPGRWPPGGNRP